MKSKLIRNVFLYLSITLYGINCFSAAEKEVREQSGLVPHSVLASSEDSEEEVSASITESRSYRRGKDDSLKKTIRRKPGKISSGSEEDDDSAVEGGTPPSRRRGQLVLHKALPPAAREYIENLMREIEKAGPDGARRWVTLKQQLSIESNA